MAFHEFTSWVGCRFKFDKDYNWIMMAVNKINETNSVTIRKNCCQIDDIINVKGDNLLLNIFKACVIFVEESCGK